MSGETSRQGESPAGSQTDRRRSPRSGAATQGELGAALMRFRQRLATFGLGEVTPPLLDEVGGTGSGQEGP